MSVASLRGSDRGTRDRRTPERMRSNTATLNSSLRQDGGRQRRVMSRRRRHRPAGVRRSRSGGRLWVLPSSRRPRAPDRPVSARHALSTPDRTRSLRTEFRSSKSHALMIIARKRSRRSVSKTRSLRTDGRTSCRQRIDWPTSGISSTVIPATYASPMIAPELVPHMTSGRIPARSRTRRTPMCARPRAIPPPRARPMLVTCLLLGWGGT